MKIYFACCATKEPYHCINVGCKTVLLSYHYYKKEISFIQQLLSENVDVFIDSGAFSAENSGKNIDIQDYIKFLKLTGAKTYAGLDVIGNAKATMVNQKIMEEAGLSPIPTFHIGEHKNDLYDLVSQYDYIALGGMVMSPKIEKWLDAVWNRMLKIKQNIKVHAFGMTNITLIAKYPWYSVDSSSFKSGKRFGRLILYNSETNKWNTLNYNDWLKKYYALTFDKRILEDRLYQYAFTDGISALSYQRYVDYINSKEQNFAHVTAQQGLFG